MSLLPKTFPPTHGTVLLRSRAADDRVRGLGRRPPRVHRRAVRTVPRVVPHGHGVVVGGRCVDVVAQELHELVVLRSTPERSPTSPRFRTVQFVRRAVRAYAGDAERTPTSPRRAVVLPGRAREGLVHEVQVLPVRREWRGGVVAAVARGLDRDGVGRQCAPRSVDVAVHVDVWLGLSNLGPREVPELVVAPFPSGAPFAMETLGDAERSLRGPGHPIGDVPSRSCRRTGSPRRGR